MGVSPPVMGIGGAMPWRLPANAGLPVSLALVFGGAPGNPWDRLLRGMVTVADSAITIGAALLAVAAQLPPGRLTDKRSLAACALLLFPIQCLPDI